VIYITRHCSLSCLVLFVPALIIKLIAEIILTHCRFQISVYFISGPYCTSIIYYSQND
ncbi:hypothetical protein C0J52_16267, partial [Blattella germanica]